MGRPIVCGISVRKDITSSELNQALYKLVHICSNSSTYQLVMMEFSCQISKKLNGSKVWDLLN